MEDQPAAPAMQRTISTGRKLCPKGLRQHAIQCRICNSPCRGEIERGFLAGTSPETLVAKWNVSSQRAMYRHMHARGLFEHRCAYVVEALDRIAERVEEVSVTAPVVIGAVRLLLELERRVKKPQESDERRRMAKRLKRAEAKPVRALPQVRAGAAAAIRSSPE